MRSVRPRVTRERDTFRAPKAKKKRTATASQQSLLSASAPKEAPPPRGHPFLQARTRVLSARGRPAKFSALKLCSLPIVEFPRGSLPRKQICAIDHKYRKGREPVLHDLACTKVQARFLCWPLVQVFFEFACASRRHSDRAQRPATSHQALATVS